MLDVYLDWNPKVAGFREQPLNELGPDSFTSKCRQQGNIHQSDFISTAIHVKAASGFTRDHDHVKRRPLKLVHVIGVLRMKLEVQELLFLFIRPWNYRQFLGPGRCIDPSEEW